MILLRVDDFPLTKPEEAYQHNLVNFMKFDELVRSVVPEYLLAVIPRHADVVQLNYLKANPHIKVALHGVNHDERYQNEFGAHLTRADVVLALWNAKKDLEAAVNREVDVYVPPHNAFDLRTVQALADCEFDMVCGGPGSPDISKWDWPGLVYAYSEFPKEYGRSDELLQRGSVEHLRETKDKIAYLTLHWTWETNIGLDHLAKYLGELKGLFGSWG